MCRGKGRGCGARQLFPTCRKEQRAWAVAQAGLKVCGRRPVRPSPARAVEGLEAGPGPLLTSQVSVPCHCCSAALPPSPPPRRPADPLSTVVGLTHHTAPCPQGHLPSLCSSGPYLRPRHWVLLGPRAGLLCPLSALVQACHTVGAEESLAWLHEAGPLVSGRGGTGVLGKGRQG